MRTAAIMFVETFAMWSNGESCALSIAGRRVLIVRKTPSLGGKALINCWDGNPTDPGSLETQIILCKMGISFFFSFVFWKEAEGDREREVKIGEEERKEENVNGINPPVTLLTHREVWNLANTWRERVFKIYVCCGHGKCINNMCRLRMWWQRWSDESNLSRICKNFGHDLGLSLIWTWNLSQLYLDVQRPGEPHLASESLSAVEGETGSGFRRWCFLRKVNYQCHTMGVGSTLLKALFKILVLKLYSCCIHWRAGQVIPERFGLYLFCPPGLSTLTCYDWS